MRRSGRPAVLGTEIRKSSVGDLAISTRSSTESTWNPLTGCTKVSPGCQHCYAERMSRRLKAMGKPNDRNGVFFFKQWGGVRKKRNGRLLDGRTWDEMPAAAFAG